MAVAVAGGRGGSGSWQGQLAGKRKEITAKACPELDEGRPRGFCHELTRIFTNIYKSGRKNGKRIGLSISRWHAASKPSAAH